MQINRDNIVAVVNSVLRQERETYKNFLSEQAIAWGRQLIATVGADKKLSARELADLEAMIDRDNVYAAVWWYSVLYELDKSNAVHCRYVDYIWQHKEDFSPNTLCFLLWQVVREKFVNAVVLDTLENKKTEFRWRSYLNDKFQGMVKADLSRLPPQERNPKRILVIIDQQLPPPHAPSIISLGYCEQLLKAGYEVTLLNTAEVMSQVGSIPLAKIAQPNYVSQWEGVRRLAYNDVEIPYIQMPLNMPNPVGVTKILNYVREQKPVLILCVDVGGIAMHLADKIVPAVSVPMGRSVPFFNTCFYAHFFDLTDDDWEFIRLQGADERNMIPKALQYNFVPQRDHITRRAVNLPDDAFVMAVVGNRLGEELDRDFLSMLERLTSVKMQVMFVGEFDYAGKVSAYPHLKENSVYLGYCMDLLSRLELCDIFVNPKRSGGGTSGAMALYQGKPVVTVATGDIAGCVGEQFWVKDYVEMEQQIMRYVTEPAFYNEMSQKAKQRGIFLTDNKKSLLDVINEAIKRCRELEL